MSATHSVGYVLCVCSSDLLNSCCTEGVATQTLLTVVPVALNEQLEGVAHNGPEIRPLIQSCPQEAGQGAEGLKKVHWSCAEPWQQRPDLEMGESGRERRERERRGKREERD